MLTVRSGPCTYDDPRSGRRITRSIKATTQKDAEKAANKWEMELQEGRYSSVSRCTWLAFRTRFEDEHLSSLADQTEATYCSALNSFERICRPKKPTDMTTSKLSYLMSELRREKKSESTIACYLRHLRAVVSWAIGMDILTEMQRPKCKSPQRAKGTKAKGRPITGEEFDRMISKVDAGLLAPLRKKKEGKRTC